MNLIELREKTRFYGIAFFDVILTYLAAFIFYPVVSKYISKKHYYPLFLPLAVITHYIFNIHTTFNTELGNGSILHWLILIIPIVIFYSGMY